MPQSIKFPNMFNKTSTNVWRANEYNKSTTQNTILLLGSERGELLGDPYFGLLIKHFIFDQNNYILKDAIIDTIYTQLSIFIPQVKVARKDISVLYDKGRGTLHCKFIGINQIDYATNTYNLVLYEENK